MGKPTAVPLRLSRQFKVALLVQTSSEWSRQVLAGVAEYASQQGSWDFWIEPRGLYEDLRLPLGWLGDGIICRLTGEPMAHRLVSHSLPAVNVSWLNEHSRLFPKVVSDEVACGEMAGDFFLSGGWEYVGYVGPPPTLAYSSRLVEALAHRLAKNGTGLHVYEQRTATRLVSVRDQQARMGIG